MPAGERFMTVRVLQRESGSDSRAGFTLVELLTIVAILAVLACLLFPAIRVAREAVDSAQCSSNLRQLAAGGISYGIENEGFFPGYWWYVPGTIRRGGMADKVGLPQIRSGGNTVMTCPTAQRKRPVTSSNFPYNRTYAINGWMRSYGSDEVTLYGVPVRFSQVSNPAKVLFFMDSPNCYVATGNGWFYDHCSPTQKWASAQAAANDYLKNENVYAHSGRLNAAFLDGHVESIRKEEMATLMNDASFWSGMN